MQVYSDGLEMRSEEEEEAARRIQSLEANNQKNLADYEIARLRREGSPSFQKTPPLSASDYIDHTRSYAPEPEPPKPGLEESFTPEGDAAMRLWEQWKSRENVRKSWVEKNPEPIPVPATKDIPPEYLNPDAHTRHKTKEGGALPQYLIDNPGLRRFHPDFGSAKDNTIRGVPSKGVSREEWGGEVAPHMGEPPDTHDVLFPKPGLVTGRGH